MDDVIFDLFIDFWESVIEELSTKALLDEISKISKKDWSDKIKVSVEINKELDVNITIIGLSYLIYKEFGVKQQPMKWLSGKTLPIKIKNNKVNVVFDEPPDFFRKVTDDTFSKDSLYNKVGKAFWHPGLTPDRFVERAVGVVVEEVNRLVNNILGG